MNRICGGLVLMGMLLVAGCSESDPPVGISGQIREGGQALKINTQGLPPGDKGIRVGFIRQSPPDTFYANVAADGSFTVPGPKNRGIPAGQYKISVQVGATGMPDQHKDAFKADKTPLSVTIPAGRSVTVEIDLTAKTATAR